MGEATGEDVGVREVVAQGQGLGEPDEMGLAVGVEAAEVGGGEPEAVEVVDTEREGEGVELPGGLVLTVAVAVGQVLAVAAADVA